MTSTSFASALLATAVIVAALVIRTAVRETREPGSARKAWAFLPEPRALASGLVVASGLSAVAWTAAGPAYLPWAWLAGLFAAQIHSRMR
ncbi:hypothetical protein [Streptomyces sp. NPDC004435]|uniref:hypothetical protein n=1 Tax=Streptomyces sp. NPDC004435 TaxID=3364701 RepID=UPI003688B0B1